MIQSKRNQTGAIHLLGILIIIVIVVMFFRTDDKGKNVPAPAQPPAPTTVIPAPAQNQAEMQFLEYCANLAKAGTKSQACEDYFASKLIERRE